jgi:hypothetical protein
MPDTVFGQELLTTGSLTTYAGLTAIVFGFTNAIKVAFGYDPKPLGLAISVVVCVVASFWAQGTAPAGAVQPPAKAAEAAAGAPAPAVTTGQTPPTAPLPLRLLVALANACLIYLTAQGATATGNTVVNRPPVVPGTSRPTSQEAQARIETGGGAPAEPSVLQKFFRPW